MAQNDPPNVYPVRNACACERPNVVRDVNGWVACLKCGKLPPEQVGAETNIDNTYSVGHGQTSDEPQGQAEAGPESQEGSGGRQEVQPQGRAEQGQVERAERTPTLTGGRFRMEQRDPVPGRPRVGQAASRGRDSSTSPHRRAR